MTTAAEHIKDFLLTKGYTFGGTADWSIWIGKQPDKPDRCITLYDIAGRTPDPRWLLDYPSIQVRVRAGQGAAGYQDATQAAKRVRSLLLGKASFDAISGNLDRIVAINGIGDVGFTGWDSSNRPEFTVNFGLIIEPAPTPDDNREPL